MADLIVLAFKDEAGAEAALASVADLQSSGLVTLDDAATVVRKPDGSVHVKQATGLVGQGALRGAFGGALVGLVFFVPWVGMAIGAVSGAILGKLRDVGIDDGFIRRVAEGVDSGQSALFMLVRTWDEPAFVERLGPMGASIVRTSLTLEDERKLRAAFGVSYSGSDGPGSSVSGGTDQS